MNSTTGDSKVAMILKDTKNGKGVFAGRDFRKGELLLEVHGKLFTLEELPYPYEEGEDRWMQVSEDLFLGPTGDFDDYINHSCDPNTGIKIAQSGSQSVSQMDCYKRDKKR